MMIRNTLFSIDLSCDDKELYEDIVKQLVSETEEAKLGKLKVQIKHSEDIQARRKNVENKGIHILKNEILLKNVHFLTDYYLLEGTFGIIYGQFAVVIFSREKIEVFYNRSHLKKIYHSVYIPYLFCTSILYEISSLLGILVLNASGIAKNGMGILLSGPKGSGKSTLALGMSTLLNYQYFSDDKVLYDPRSKLIYAFSDVVRLSKEMYQSVARVQTAEIEYFRDKFTINISNLAVEKCSIAIPKIVVFPCLDYTKKYQFKIRKIEKMRTFEKILEHRIVAFEPPFASFQKNILDFLNVCQCYEIFLGTDLNFNVQKLDEFFMSL